MFHDRLRALAKPILDPVARVLHKLHITPNQVTVFGFILTSLAAVLISQGRMLAGGVVLAMGAALDAVDGYLARVAYQESPFGAFLDSTLDRLSEVVVYLGLLVNALHHGNDAQAILVFAAVTSSLMVSYSRARAEGLQAHVKVGLGARPERLFLLIVGLLLNQVTFALWVIFLLASFTVFQRIFWVWRRLETADNPE
ncbi:MAG: CDP-alcohol phosphatidyltransferase family protein [Chloroflexi bacterium]|nr:CDP-alcohol phosphatidyltransferase family protein [Chloroflexota bacterium]